MKQTAVEFLYKFVQLKLTDEQQAQFEGLFQQALEMEKEHIRVAYMEGAFEKMRHLNGKDFILPEQYYNETFKSE